MDYRLQARKKDIDICLIFSPHLAIKKLSVLRSLLFILGMSQDSVLGLKNLSIFVSLSEVEGQGVISLPAILSLIGTVC